MKPTYPQDLPPPSGTMTVTYGFDRKVKVPMWDEAAMRAYAAAAVRAEREACAEVVDGFDACDPRHIAAAIRARGNT